MVLSALTDLTVNGNVLAAIVEMSVIFSRGGSNAGSTGTEKLRRIAWAVAEKLNLAIAARIHSPTRPIGDAIQMLRAADE